ncbi:hypothetical protein EGW08_021144 [Elysia chlorotica]|uniref:Uncharacterized protein n=1 Tax=Elysia chlorotica TaxID=188477 RepID=A0A433SPB8_ELYCH|nr:hypothetical protein EGW08_021144 [Elysia chlorotica]
MCGHLATFEDGAEQREDITGDSSGEISEECQTGIHNGANTNSHFLDSVDSAVNANTDTSSSEKPCEVISSAEENRLEEQSPQKRENLSLVSGLEQWLDQLKHQVNTGLDSDMNRLFLQATSQLKVIADKVMAGKVETKADSGAGRHTVSSTVSSKSQSPVKPTSSGSARYGSTTSANSDSSVKAQLMRQLENVQNHRLSPRQETASVSAQECLRTDLNSTSRQSTKPAETERCKVDLDKRKVGDTLSPGLEDLKPGPSLGRMDDSGEESLPTHLESGGQDRGVGG